MIKYKTDKKKGEINNPLEKWQLIIDEMTNTLNDIPVNRAFPIFYHEMHVKFLHAAFCLLHF